MSTKVKLFSILSVSAAMLAAMVVGVPTAQASSLDTYEVESLLFIREEEKLARDTYLALYEIWGADIFQTIADSEQNHMDAVLGLLDQYNLEDPASPEHGVFQNEYLQEKYFELVAWGETSLAAALLVGATIEELDLIDLAERMAKIDNPDILKVFQNLTDGSENHLRAFVRSYENLTGESYEPVYLDLYLYQQIINGSSDSGDNGEHFSQERHRRHRAGEAGFAGEGSGKAGVVEKGIEENGAGGSGPKDNSGGSRGGK